MIKVQYHRILYNALSNAKRYDFTPNEFHYMLDGIMLCAQHDYSISSEEYAEIIAYRDKVIAYKDKIAEEIGK